MSNNKATDAVLAQYQHKRYYAEVDKDGKPINKQIPLTYMRYNGGGNETIVYDGSNILVIDSQLAAGPLTISFGNTLPSIRNLLGRKLDIIFNVTTLSGVVIDYNPGTIYVSGSGAIGPVYNIPVGINGLVTCSFYKENEMLLDTNDTIPVPLEGFSAALQVIFPLQTLLNTIIFDSVNATPDLFNVGGMYDIGTGIATTINAGYYQYNIILGYTYNFNVDNMYVEAQLYNITTNRVINSCFLFYPGINDVVSLSLSGCIYSTANTQYSVRMKFNLIANVQRQLFPQPNSLFSMYRIK